MWDNPARASEGGGEGAPGTRIEIALQTIVQGGADMHGQPVQSDVFPFLFLQEVKKKRKTQDPYKDHNFPVDCEHWTSGELVSRF